jgi:metal-sulfur cluster biosynthetic enzyme
MSDSRPSALDAIHAPDLSAARDDALRLEVIAALGDVIDPELGIDIVDLGLVYGVDVDDAGVHVRLTMTTAACPLGEQLVADVEDRLRATGHVDAVDVEVVWEPPWGPERMSEAARRALGWAT